MPTPSAAASILLVRHARAAAARPGETDFDRPLDSRGLADAGRIADAIGARGWSLGTVLCSPALRCRQTADRIIDVNPPLTLSYIDDLYEGPLGRYRQLIDAAQTGQPVTLVGHNPLIEQLVWQLLGEGEAAEALPGGFTPGAVVVIERTGSGRHGRLVATLFP